MSKNDDSLTLDDVVFVGFNRRVAAIDKKDGGVVWDWKAPSGTGFVSLLVDFDRVYVAVQGHVYCLDATSGQQLWHNPMKGFGFGVTCIATIHGCSHHEALGEAEAEAARQAASAGA